LTYTYDNVGNVTKIVDPVNGNQILGYDELNRLTQATGPYGTHVYAYNEIGNMTCNSALSACSSTSANYTYGDPLHKHAVTSAAGMTYAYDKNGNMTNRESAVLT